MNTRNRTPAQHAVARKIAHQRRWIGRTDRPDAQATTRSPEMVDCQRASEIRTLTDNAGMLADATGITLEQAIRNLYPEGLAAKAEELLKRDGWTR